MDFGTQELFLIYFVDSSKRVRESAACQKRFRVTNAMERARFPCLIRSPKLFQRYAGKPQPRSFRKKFLACPETLKTTASKNYGRSAWSQESATGKSGSTQPFNTMNKEQLAEILNGRTYGDEIAPEEIKQARKDGLLVVYGVSDDLVEFDGLFGDEIGAFNGTEFAIDEIGVMPRWEDVSDDEDHAEQYFKRKGQGKKVKAIWGGSAAAWTFETEIPHAKFTITDEGEPFCIGMVIERKDLEP